MPLDRSTAQRVERYRAHSPEIRFLPLERIDEQLKTWCDKPQLEVMGDADLHGLHGLPAIAVFKKKADWRAV